MCRLNTCHLICSLEDSALCLRSFLASPWTSQIRVKTRKEASRSGRTLTRVWSREQQRPTPKQSPLFAIQYFRCSQSTQRFLRIFLWPKSVTRQPRRRITVRSTTKSFFDNTHYKMVGVPAEETSVLLNNGLSLKLFGRIRKSWMVMSFSVSSVERLCTPPRLRSGPYSSLHFSKFGT